MNNAIVWNQYGHGSARVLVVDDEPTTAAALLHVLAGMGCDVVVALHGEDAIDLLKSEHFNLFIMDWMMPKMDGHGLLEMLGGLHQVNAPMHRRIIRMPLIIHTGLDQSELKLPKNRDAFNLLGILRKPSRLPELAKLVSKALGEK